MGATYTRQSSYTDGDVITAAHTNDEFDQLLAAFQASSGHTHDGTANEGGPITKLLGNTLTFGAGTAGTDITITFDGETSDGVLKWMEDEDYFEFSDDILVASTEKLQFRDTAIYINSSTDGQLDLVADTEIQIAATTVDLNGNLDVSGSITLGGTAITSTAAELNILDGVTSTAAELNILDGVTSTATELNVMDGDTSATSTTVADADRVVFNDAGTMKQVAVTDLAAYFDDEITAMPNLVTTAATTVGALNSGSITSGFGSIDNGSSAITTTGTVTYGSLSDGSITITAFVDEDNMASNSATLVPTQQSVKAYVDTQLTAEDLDVTTDSGTIAIDLDSETLTIAGGTGLASSASSNTVTLAVDAAQTGITSVVNSSLELGRDADNRIKFGTDNQIIFEVSGGDNVIFKASGEIEATSLDISGGVDVDGTTDLDDTDIDGTLVVDGSNISLDSTSTLNIDNSNTSNGITIGTATSGVPISIGHTTSEVTVNDNLTVTGDLTVSGTTTTVNSTTVNLNDHNIVLDSGNSTSAVINGAGITIEGGSGDDATFSYNTTGPKFELKLGSSHEDLQVDQLIASSLDISGNVDVDGTLEADVITVNGTALNTVIAGVTVTNATTAAVATTVTISDNESTNEENAVVFTAGGDVDGGNIGLESDGDLTYNPSTGTVTATVFKGNIDAVDGDFDGTLEADAITVGGTALNTVIAGVTVTNATNSAHVLVTDNESTNEENLITFVEDATSSTGNVGLEMDGHLTYNPSTGTVTATVFKGNIDAVDGDFDGTLEADAITVGGASLSSVIQDEATALAIALG